MTKDVYCSRVVPRSRSSHAAQTRFSPRQTCSAVTSGFFPPQARCPASYERQRHTAQRQMAQQGRVAPPLEVAEAQLTLAQADLVLDVPAAKRHAHDAPHRLARRRVGHEVLLLAR